MWTPGGAPSGRLGRWPGLAPDDDDDDDDGLAPTLKREKGNRFEMRTSVSSRKKEGKRRRRIFASGRGGKKKTKMKKKCKNFRIAATMWPIISLS